MSGAGDTLAGVYAPEPGESRIPPEVPTAPRFEPSSNAYAFDEFGRVASVHPIDHRVALMLSVERGSLPAAPDVGNTLRYSLSVAGKDQRQRAAEQSVADALATLVRAGDITIDEVLVDSPNRDVVSVRYTNLRTGRVRNAFG